MTTKALIAGLFLALVSNAWAQSGSVSLALPNKANSIQKQAQDLVKDGKVLDEGEATSLGASGFDLSTLNPVEDKIWQNKVYPTSDASTRNYPSADKGVELLPDFLKIESGIKFSALFLTRSKENPKLFFRLGLSLYAQPVMMRAALLRKLGFFVPSPKFYKNLKVTFKDEAQKEKFIADAIESSGVDIEDRGWIQANDKKNHTIVLTSAILEHTSADYYDFAWGGAPNPLDPAQKAITERFWRSRAFRALLLPYVLVDAPEAIDDRFTPRFGHVSGGMLNVPYYKAESFQACTYQDMKWVVATRLSKLTMKDFEEIVAEAQYPAGYAQLVLAKIVSRANDAFTKLGVRSQLSQLPVRISTADGLVQDGKVMKERVDGYPQRFTHGERKSPFVDGDMMRYLSLEGKTSILASAIGFLNKKLDIVGVDDAAKKAANEYNQEIMDRIRRNPREPIHSHIKSWGGNLLGFRVNSSRHISTGTFNGSTAPLQLVDNLSVAGSLGRFQSIAGLDYQPIAGVNISKVRDYTHVRPLLTVDENKSVPWKNLLVPKFMKNLVKVLENAEVKNPDDESTMASIDSFFNEMRDGEVFTISDSIAETAYLQASSSLDVLLGLQKFNFLNSVSLGSDANRVITRQVSFFRVMNGGFNGVHVYVRELNMKGFGAELNFNYFLNVLKARAEKNGADIITHAYVINLQERMTAKDPDAEATRVGTMKEDLRLALVPLFRDNNTEVLSTRFQEQKLDIEHKLDSKNMRLKFLAWRLGKFQEDHMVSVTPPKNSAYPDLDPKNEKITLYSSRVGELKGFSMMDLIYDLLDGVIAQKGLSSKIQIARSTNDGNPSNTPLGRAHWRTVKTEVDLTTNGASNEKPVAIVQHVWGGWSLKKNDFFSLIDDINKQFESKEVAPYALINPNDFNGIQKFDFYRVTANLSVLNNGIDKLRDLILQPNSQAASIPDIFLKIKCSGNSTCLQRSVTEKGLYEDLLRILGNGDVNLGQAVYKDTCNTVTQRNTEETFDQKGHYRDGVMYACLANWHQELIKLSRNFPAAKHDQARWMTQVLAILDDKIPMPQLLKYIGVENYMFVVRFNGFREGNADGDLEYFSHTYGDPSRKYPEAGGLINMLIQKTGVMPTELDRTLGGFQ